MSDWVDVGAKDELRPGTSRVVEVDRATVAVFNLNGEYYAIEDLCTHDEGELASGAVEGEEIICPRHGARFNIKTGKVTAPPAYEDIATFPVREHEGRIQVRDDRWG
jgi:3-phenylpropionate/trans-cinnamate dioxygenase ferredoxin subunit